MIVKILETSSFSY